MQALSWETELSGGESPITGLRPALQRLDARLRRAAAAAQDVYGPSAAADPYRGLYVSQEDVSRLLDHEPGGSTLQTPGDDPAESLTAPLAPKSRWAYLERAFQLSTFDLDVILVALAPEIHLRYERLYGFLQDDVTRRRPTVDLALQLLCPSAEARLARRDRFAPEAPLIRQALLHLVADPHHHQPPLLAHSVVPDEQIVRWLLAQEGLDPRLAPFCQKVVPVVDSQEVFVSVDAARALRDKVAQARSRRQPLRLHFHGPVGSGKRRTAEALAGEIGASLLVIDLPRAAAGESDFARLMRLLFREAGFQDAVVYLDGVDRLLGDDRPAGDQRLIEALVEATGIVIFAGTQAWMPGPAPAGHEAPEVISISFPVPDFARRRACWQARLAAHGIDLDAADMDTLAGRFRLAPGQIAAAVSTACSQAGWHGATSAANGRPSETPLGPTLKELCAGARLHSSHGLTTLARKVEPRSTWNDIILPPDQMAQLGEICDHARYRHIVFGEWGFERKLSLGKGLSVLFSGPPGTGKTMAAEVLANELQLDLYKIDLSQVVSKYIGETEKNLDRIFTAAANANAILFFDEADALFGKRSEVKDAHDRYANIEIGYLLQKMEEYEGSVILATNLRQNMDEAFVRRIQAIIEFPFPDEEYRRRIWQAIFPREAPVAEEVDFDRLAGEIKLAGGNIKNIALAAAFAAAADGGVIRIPHLMRAARREHQKLGRAWSETARKGEGVSTTLGEE